MYFPGDFSNAIIILSNNQLARLESSIFKELLENMSTSNTNGQQPKLCLNNSE